MKLGRAFKISDASLVASNVPETEAPWNGATPYAIDAVVRQTVGGVHRAFRSKVAANVGSDPANLDADKWEDLGPTNRWAQYDQRLQLQTENADSIYSKIQVTGRVDALYVGNISAREMRVVATEVGGAGVVYDKTIRLVSTSRIRDWARWFREPIVKLRDKGLTDLPSGYADLQIEVTLSDPGQVVRCGELVLAYTAKIGGTQWGGALSNKSYTTIDEDAFGDDFIVRRGRKRTGDFGVLVDNRDLDDVTTLLDDADGQAVLYIPSDKYSATFIFGLLLGWQEVVQWPRRTALSMNIQSFVK